MTCLYTLVRGSLEEAGPWVLGGPLHPSASPAFSPKEDTRAQRQRLQKQLTEHLRQSWGLLGAPIQARDLGELLQAWGAGAKTGAPKGSRFTHSEKFTFHLVGAPEDMGCVAGCGRLGGWLFVSAPHLYPHTRSCVPTGQALAHWGWVPRGPLAS